MMTEFNFVKGHYPFIHEVQTKVLLYGNVNVLKVRLYAEGLKIKP